MTKYVLLVDDDEDMRDVVAEILRAEGYAVTCVDNGLSALEYVAGHGVPSLVMMDLTMPVMDGRQFLAERRKYSSLTHVPFVVLTGNTTVTAEDLGADEVIYKPIDLERLLGVVRRYHALASGLYQTVEKTPSETG